MAEREKYFNTMNFEEKQEYLLRLLEKYRLPTDPKEKLSFYFEQVSIVG